MTEPTPILDDEWILRHIPGGTHFQNPPDKPITSENFKLRHAEAGLSVSRYPPTSPFQLVTRVGSIEKGSKVAACKASDLRNLGLELRPDPLPDDEGHSLVVPASSNFESRTMRQRLARVFRYVDEIPELSEAISKTERVQDAGEA